MCSGFFGRTTGQAFAFDVVLSCLAPSACAPESQCPRSTHSTHQPSDSGHNSGMMVVGQPCPLPRQAMKTRAFLGLGVPSGFDLKLKRGLPSYSSSANSIRSPMQSGLGRRGMSMMSSSKSALRSVAMRLLPSSAGHTIRWFTSRSRGSPHLGQESFTMRWKFGDAAPLVSRCQIVSSMASCTGRRRRNEHGPGRNGRSKPSCIPGKRKSWGSPRLGRK